MMNEEMITKAKEAKSVEELIALAKENGIELTEEDAKMYFEQLSAKKGELSDDELDNVAGGGCETKVDGKTYTVVTNGCNCFTGQYLNNWKSIKTNEMSSDPIYAKDHSDLRQTWCNFCMGIEGICGSCAHLCFKDGLGYCGKS